MPEIIINADDFGLHPDINEGILTCAEKKIINSISAIPHAPYTEYETLKNLYDKTFVGCHVSFIGLEWMTDKLFFADWKQFIFHLIINRGNLKKIEVEADAQINLMLEKGIQPDHIDSHQHVHHFPFVWQIFDSLKAKHKIERIRCCKTAHFTLNKLSPAGLLLSKMASTQFDEKIHYYAAGLRYSGNNNIQIIEKEIKLSSGKKIELIMHPAVSNKRLSKIFPEWNFDWKGEFDGLMNDKMKNILETNQYFLKEKSINSR
jgi:chitin disaccharide deacetylase